MPHLAGGKRKKRRTHNELSEDDVKKVPRSFVIKRGKVNPSIKMLVSDWRQVMSPYCAVKLKESSRNSLKDFINVSGVLGVSHLMLFSQTNVAAYMRIGKLPEGPTLTFKILKYSLISDVRKHQKKSRVSQLDFTKSPLVILNGFREGSSGRSLKRSSLEVSEDNNRGTEEETQAVPQFARNLMSTLLGHMYPGIDISTVTASSCRRVVLFHLNRASGVVSVRHYTILRRPGGLTRGVKKIVRLRNNPSKLLDLKQFRDVSDFILRSGEASDSEVEDGVEVSAPDTKKHTGKESVENIALSLHEIGPRLSLQLMKIEEGVSCGKVLYHRFVESSTHDE